jgi:signal transduction histidine kinase
LGQRCEHRIIAADGVERWFHSGFQEERNGQGIPIRLRGLSVNIDPMKALERTLRDAVRAREEIVAIVAHDLKNPLSIVDLSASLILRHAGMGQEEAVVQQTHRIKRSVARAVNLAQDILDVTKVESGRFTITSKPESIKSLCEEAAEMLQPAVDDKKIQLKVQVPADDIDAICDHGRILQVLSNLAGNAVKFTPENGSITIRVTSDERNVIISVIDSGIGIAASEIPHLFERFWQSKPTNKGIGLGLYIAHGIVAAHGGNISVESTLGLGTTFSFTLPKFVTPKVITKHVDSSVRIES